MADSYVKPAREAQSTADSDVKPAREAKSTADTDAKPAREMKTTADSDVKQPIETVQEEKKNLKYLDFVQVIAIHVLVYLSTLYEYAKENSGPLKSGVQTVEGTVKAVIGPVYHKFQGVPFQLITFVDRKVDESIHELDRRLPATLKQVSIQLFSASKKAPEVAREVAAEVHRVGVVDAANNIVGAVYIKYEPKAKELYLKYEPVAEHYAVSAWRSLNRLPLFPQVAQIVVPTAAHWCEKYNDVVIYATGKGYTVSHYLPLVPTEKIAKVFEGGAEKVTHTSHGDESLPVSA